MRIRFLLLALAGFAILGATLTLSLTGSKKPNYVPRSNQVKEITGISGAMEWIFARRVNQETNSIDFKDVAKAMQQVAFLKSKKSTTSDLSWTEMGPDNVGGRTRAILIDKDTPSLMFAGGVAGGLWKSSTSGQSWVNVKYNGDNNSTGVDIDDIIANLSVSCIVQAQNGDIYFGTGENYANPEHGTNFNTGAYGQGIWKSTDRGNTFTRLTSTWSDDASKDKFCLVNRLAADPNNPNRIYAATIKGLQVTDDGGASWYNPIHNGANQDNQNNCEDVKVGKNGTVVAVVGHYPYISDNGGNDSFTKHIISNSASRTEIAIAPSDDNYIYAQVAKGDGSLLGVYKSTNKGVDWTVIGPGGSENLAILGNQGWYDNVIAVFPNNKDRIICGGQFNLWTKSPTENWTPITHWAYPEISPLYVHADHHAIVFHPTNPNILFVGSDGGISKSTDGAMSFITLNKNYNVTQFYSVGVGPDYRVMGGTQDNGTQYIDFSGNTGREFYSVKGGDGGFCEISALRPEVMFGTTYYGNLKRTEAKGESLDLQSHFYNSRMINKFWATNAENIGSSAYSGVCSFVTPIVLWESFNDTHSADSVWFKATRTYTAGEVIHGKSNVNERDIPYTLTTTLNNGDSIKLQDPYQAILALGMNKSVWITRDAINFKVNPARWFPLTPDAAGVGMVTTLTFSADGNHLYYAAGNVVYRASNILNARTGPQMDGEDPACLITNQVIGTFSGFVTSIATDPGNPENIIVTLGGFSNGAKVYYSTNAASTTATTVAANFTAKHSNLPQMPVYSGAIIWNDYKKVLIGTEYGVYSTDDITASSPVWVDQNSVFGNVPVYMIRQQLHTNGWKTGVENHGCIYIATHGRGIFRTDNFKGPVGIFENPYKQASLANFEVYPNPVRDNTFVKFDLPAASDVDIKIYDFNGRVVKCVALENQSVGAHNVPISAEGLQKGTYIVSITAGQNKATKKIVVL